MNQCNEKPRGKCQNPLNIQDIWGRDAQFKKLTNKLAFPQVPATLIFVKENLKNDTSLCRLSVVHEKKEREYIMAFFLFSLNHHLSLKQK